MKFLKWFSLALTCIGAFLCYRAPMLSSSERWHPVEGPVPGPGLTVALPFFIDSGGTYSFEIQVPVPPENGVAMPNRPSLQGSLQVTITGPHNFRVADHIASLGHTADYPFGQIGYFQAGRRFDLPGRGDYVLRIAADAQQQSWSTSGAICGLTLNENATNAMIGAQLGRVMGLVLLVLGVLGLIIHTTKTA